MAGGFSINTNKIKIFKQFITKKYRIFVQKGEKKEILFTMIVKFHHRPVNLDFFSLKLINFHRLDQVILNQSFC